MKELLDAYYCARSWLDRQAGKTGTTDDGRWPCRKFVDAFEQFLAGQSPVTLTPITGPPRWIPGPWEWAPWSERTGTGVTPVPQQTEITCGPRAHE